MLVRIARLAAGTPTERAAYLEPTEARGLDRAVLALGHGGFVLAVVVSVALVFGVAAGGQDWVPWFRVGAGVLLVAEGLLLTRDWRGARRQIVARSYRRSRRRRGGSATFAHVALWRVAAPLLGLLGLAWFLAGAIAAALGFAALL
jgi:hypothetical protein